MCWNKVNMGVESNLLGLLPYAVMVTLECLDVGLTTLSKAAMSRGMSHYVFVVYSNVLATLLVFPSSFLFLRSSRPPITFRLLCKFFILALVGTTLMQNCVFTGLSYSSPTLGSAISQLVPAFTFLLAVIFRMEKFDLTSLRSQIKVMGTLVSIAGALTIILYKGPPIGSKTTSPSNLPSTYPLLLATTNPWVIGGLFLVTASLSLSISTTFQAAILKEYPSEMTLVSFSCLFGAIQCAVVSLLAERNPDAWKLSPDIELIAIIYSAIFGNMVTYGGLAWCIHKKGPVFVALFKPLSIAIAAFMGVMFLGDTLHVGSIVGAFIIVAGFYGVVWAQSKEEQGEASKISWSPVSSQKTPLLDSRTNV